MAERPSPSEGILLTHFIVAEDAQRSRAFYADVLGDELGSTGPPLVVHRLDVGDADVEEAAGAGRVRRSLEDHLRLVDGRPAPTLMMTHGLGPPLFPRQE
jgi:hypothetical protein